MDEGDHAQAREEFFRAAALTKCLGRAAGQPAPRARGNKTARDDGVAGRFGECVTCGDDIPVARLKAMPAATMCIDCQARAEKGLGR